MVFTELMFYILGYLYKDTYIFCDFLQFRPKIIVTSSGQTFFKKYGNNLAHTYNCRIKK